MEYFKLKQKEVMDRKEIEGFTKQFDRDEDGYYRPEDNSHISLEDILVEYSNTVGKNKLKKERENTARETEEKVRREIVDRLVAEFIEGTYGEETLIGKWSKRRNKYPTKTKDN